MLAKTCCSFNFLLTCPVHARASIFHILAMLRNFRGCLFSVASVVLWVCLCVVSHVPAQFSYNVVHFVLKCEIILGVDVEGGRGGVAC
jgi:hypothetical protein